MKFNRNLRPFAKVPGFLIDTEDSQLYSAEVESVTIIQANNNGECRARSDCTYVQSDLALHSPQKKSNGLEWKDMGLNPKKLQVQQKLR